MSDTPPKHNILQLGILLFLIVHWLIPWEAPLMGSGGGWLRAGLYMVLISLSLMRNSGHEHYPLLKYLLLLLIINYTIVTLSPLLWGGGLVFRMYYIWEPLFIVLLATICQTPKEIQKCFYFCIGAILFSVLWGALMMQVGGSFTSIRNAIIGIGETTEEYGELREGHEYRIVGFSKSIFSLGYLIATAGAAVVIQFFRTSGWYKRIFYFGCILLLFWGIIGNAQRSSIVGIGGGVLLWFIAMKRFHVQYFFLGLLIAIIVLALIKNDIITAQGDERRGNLLMRLQRIEQAEEDTLRYHRQKQALFAILTSWTQPPEENYAYRCQMKLGDRVLLAPHNHFLTNSMRGVAPVLFLELIIMFIIGRIVWIGHQMWKRIGDKENSEWHWIIASCLFASILCGMFHNTGLFNAEPATVIMLGLLCASYVCGIRILSSNDCQKND